MGFCFLACLVCWGVWPCCWLGTRSGLLARRYFFCGSFMFLFCLVFTMSLCVSVYMCFVVTCWERVTSWLSFVVSAVSLSLSHWYPGSGVVLDCIDSWSLHPYLLFCRVVGFAWLFSGLCYRYCGLEPRLCVGLKSLLRQGLLEPAFYGDLVYKLKKMLALVVFQLALLKQCLIIKKGNNIGVRAWWSTQSWLAALLFSLVACWWVEPRALWWVWLWNLSSLNRMVEARCCVCWQAHQGLTVGFILLR